MSDRVMVPKREMRVARPQAVPRGLKTSGRFAGGAVQYETALGQPGADLAGAVLASAAGDYQRIAALFPGVAPPQVLISIERLSPNSDGTGGAWHTTCQDATLHCDASFDSPQRTSALWIAEFVEVMEANQGKGWDCGNTNGEGLSRALAEWAYPGALDDYETASAWLDGSRPDFVDAQVGNDTDDQSNGCAVLFLYWLNSLGYDWPEIVAAGSSNLAGTYSNLTGQGDAWGAFTDAVEAQWPAGQPSGVTSDNPWGATTPPGPEPGPGPGPGPSSPASIGVSFASDVRAGNYTLMPAGELHRLAQSRGLSVGQLLALAAEVLQLLQTFFGQGKPPASSGSSATSPASSGSSATSPASSVPGQQTGSQSAGEHPQAQQAPRPQRRAKP